MPPGTFSTPAPKGRGWVLQGCGLQSGARPAKPLQTPAARPLNCLAPKGRNSIFLFRELSRRIHLNNASAFPARHQDFQEEGSLIPSESNQASHQQRHDVAIHTPRAPRQLQVNRRTPLLPPATHPPPIEGRSTTRRHHSFQLAGGSCKTSKDHAGPRAEGKAAGSLSLIRSLRGNTDRKAAREKQPFPRNGTVHPRPRTEAVTL